MHLWQMMLNFDAHLPQLVAMYVHGLPNFVCGNLSANRRIAFIFLTK